MEQACDLTARRVGSRSARKSAYWWSEDLGVLRRKCVAARRRWFRVRNNPDSAAYAFVRSEYLAVKRAFRASVKKAKIKCWNELISGIDEDPWGLPYKLVLNRLRRSSPGLSETLCRDSLRTLLDSLFPVGVTHDPFEVWRDVDIDIADCLVSDVEVSVAIHAGRRGGSPAPGPDGIPIGVWRSVSPLIVSHMAKLYTICLEEGNFPVDWKMAKLVLIPKDGSPVTNDGPLKARPICLLNDVGKIFERILATRICNFMDDNPRARLSDHQFGFRTGKSTL